MPDEWDSLSSASSGLADALVELSRAAEAAGLIADAGWRKGTKPDSWDWVDRLNLAVKALAGLVAGPTHPDCAADCLVVIRQAGRRLKTNEVIQALIRAGKTHGKSTVKNTLALLTRNGQLKNNRGRRAPGYGLPEWDS
jgi:hypothetical protein